MFAQQKSLPSSLRDAMPKALYWLGAALLNNWVLSTVLEAALGGISPQPASTVSDELFVSCVQFVHRRYLFGQSILACSVREQAWRGIDLAPEDRTGDLAVEAVKLLRSFLGAVIDKEVFVSCDLESKRSEEHGTQQERAAVSAKQQRMFQLLIDLGIGEAGHDAQGHVISVRKFKRWELSSAARHWLHQERAAMCQFGPSSAVHTGDVAAPAPPQPSENALPSVGPLVEHVGHGRPLRCLPERSGSRLSPSTSPRVPAVPAPAHSSQAPARFSGRLGGRRISTDICRDSSDCDPVFGDGSHASFVSQAAKSVAVERQAAAAAQGKGHAELRRRGRRGNVYVREVLGGSALLPAEVSNILRCRLTASGEQAFVKFNRSTQTKHLHRATCSFEGCPVSWISSYVLCCCSRARDGGDADCAPSWRSHACECPSRCGEHMVPQGQGSRCCLSSRGHDLVV